MMETARKKIFLEDLNKLRKNEKRPGAREGKSSLSQDLFSSESSDADEKTPKRYCKNRYLDRKCKSSGKEQNKNSNKEKLYVKKKEAKKCATKTNSIRTPKKLKNSSTKNSEKKLLPPDRNNLMAEESPGLIINNTKTNKDSSYISPTKFVITENAKQENSEQDERDILTLQNVNKIMKSLNNPSKPILEILKIDHLTPTHLIETFDDFRPILDEQFQEYNSQKKRTSRSLESMDHLFIFNVLSTDNVLFMVKHLHNHYEKDISESGIPQVIHLESFYNSFYAFLFKFTDLYTNVMLPEWVLGIFMREHNLSRAEAIGRIEGQKEIDTNRDDFVIYK